MLIGENGLYVLPPTYVCPFPDQWNVISRRICVYPYVFEGFMQANHVPFHVKGESSNVALTGMCDSTKDAVTIYDFKNTELYP